MGKDEKVKLKATAAKAEGMKIKDFLDEKFTMGLQDAFDENLQYALLIIAVTKEEEVKKEKKEEGEEEEKKKTTEVVDIIHFIHDSAENEEKRILSIQCQKPETLEKIRNMIEKSYSEE